MFIPNPEAGMLDVPKVKMSDLRDNPVPESVYNLRVHKAEFVQVPKNGSGNPYFKTWLVITSGPDEQFVGRMVFANYPITGNGKFRLLELLEVTGHDEDFECAASDLLNLEFKAQVGIAAGTGSYRDKNVIVKHFALTSDASASQ